MGIVLLEKSSRGAIRQILAFMRTRKIVSGLILLALVFGAYKAYGAWYAPSKAVRYVTTTVATGTVVATLTETGQVNAAQQLSLTPKTSGQITGIYAKAGDAVRAGQVIARLDDSDARRDLENARLSLETAELTYAQTTSTSTLALNLIQAKNAVTNAETALAKAHDDAYASLVSIYTDFSTVMNALDNTLHSYDVPGRSTQQNIDGLADTVAGYDTLIGIFKNAAATSYTAAQVAYAKSLIAYQATSRSASNDEIRMLAQDAYQVAQILAEAVKSAHDFFDRIKSDYSTYHLGPPTTASTLIATMNAQTNTINNDLSSALSTKTNLISAEQSLAIAQNALETAQNGKNDITIQSATLTLKKAREAVDAALETVADYVVIAPFTGTIASIDAHIYDQVGTGSTIATLIANDSYAKLSVNEIDVAKIKVGQKASITFDALPDVTIAGTVSSVNPVGSVSQGVVSYTVLIAFDTYNPLIKPGMSLSADIVVGTETGLLVPASAIKSQGNRSYVQVFSPALAGSEEPSGASSDTPPIDLTVTTGLTNDSETIIRTGISEGAQVVTQIISPSSAKSSAAQSTSAFGNRPGGPGAGAVRFIGR